MKHYDFKAIEKKWQNYWEKHHTFQTNKDTNQPKYYVLDMFPYPSGSGLHVGHPLGYIVSDIIARCKRSQGYNVLHPMGFDAFGLPAEQYAIQTGQHPAITTTQNIQRYKQQLKQLGLSFDWDRTVCTSDPAYYRWTQWIFLQLFQCWYNTAQQKAQSIASLIALFEKEGNRHVQAACDENTPIFTAQTWKQLSEKKQQALLLHYRLAYLKDMTVNWCPELGTVLANEEVKDGRSERGSYPVVRKQLKQWSLRMTAYAARLYHDLSALDWPAPAKEMQRHWIGKSEGVELTFQLQSPLQAHRIKVFTTRPETLFGVTYLALAPEHPLLYQLVSTTRQEEVHAYIAQAKNRSDRARMAEVKHITGVFTGAYTIHPFTGKPLPIWVADYVVASYGTGAVMGVPAHDSRDYAFAKHFNLPIIQVIASRERTQAAYEAKEGTLINSAFLNGLSIKAATAQLINKLEKAQVGTLKTSYRLHDPIFSRQRYWGEPFPIYYKDGMPYALPAASLPLKLPKVKSHQPSTTGEPPLSHAAHWQTTAGDPLELHTMPGWAGSSWYFWRYMDPYNPTALVGKAAQRYWQGVDLYVGGAEHVTGHLLYARFWTKFLYDLGYVNVQEPFQKLLNQGMIQHKSYFVYQVKGTQQFVSYKLRKQYDTVSVRVPIDLVTNDVLDIGAFRKWRPEFEKASFLLEAGQYICGSELEKMSKSKYNVVNPETVIEKYGADALRLHTMFLGPLTQAKPWSMHGIDGVVRFLNKLWRLFHGKEGQVIVTAASPPLEALKVIHKTIKKLQEAIQRYAFNTAVSILMICVNELTALQCHHRAVLQDLLILLAPFAPHIAEELWQRLGYTTSVIQAAWPCYEASYLQEEAIEYPIAVNGKVRAKLTFALHTPHDTLKKQVLAATTIQKWLQGKEPQKVVIVPQKMVNIVV